MKKYMFHPPVFLSVIALMVLLADPKTAIDGASLGLNVCIQSVIPALFPFFVLSAMLTNILSQERSSILLPLGRLCAIPQRMEGIFLMGLLCGYPVGAQNVYSAYAAHKLDLNTAKRLLGFCSNAGPSFIFGVTSVLFTERYIPWILWGVQIISAIMVGILLPGKTQQIATSSIAKRTTFPEALSQSVRALANVCGWVILFRTATEILNRKLLSSIPEVVTVIITGLLELTNGCIALQQLPDEGLRFVLCCMFLSTGGFCVLMQTMSVTQELGIRSYINGKILQSSLCILLATLIWIVLFPEESTPLSIKGMFAFASTLFCILTIIHFRKKEVAFSENNLYNEENAA